MFQWMGRMLMIFGAVLAAIGAVIYFGSKIGIGRLPGDIVFRKGNFTFYFPLITSLLLSLILTIIFNLFRLRR